MELIGLAEREKEGCERGRIESPICGTAVFGGKGSFAGAASDRAGESWAEYVEPSGGCDTDAAEDSIGLVTDG
jgi:hypothetical protein